MEKHSEELGFRVCMLASGSSGNVTYIETPKRRLLVDCGLSGKAVEKLMKKINRSLKDVDSILVTHEHSDHIHGVGVLARKYQLDVYANEETWAAMEHKLGKLSSEHKHIFKMGETKTFTDIDIESFGVSHDAAKPQFYSFMKDNKRFVMLTDTGYVSDRLLDQLKGAHAYLIESNHDLDMLRMGPYAWHLKQRILGDKGHLSNEDGAKTISELVCDQTKRVYLGHLSKENNMKDIAYQTAMNILIERECGVNERFKLFHTDPDEPTELFEI